MSQGMTAPNPLGARREEKLVLGPADEDTVSEDKVLQRVAQDVICILQ